METPTKFELITGPLYADDLHSKIIRFVICIKYKKRERKKDPSIFQRTRLHQ